jgi:single-strand DNA-binding protein
MYINKVILYGNLTKDPELKSLPSGMHVNSFSVATNRSVKDTVTGAKKDVPEYHNVVAFGKTAEVIHQYVKKGNPIYLEGRIQTRSWDGTDGKKNYRTEIVLDTFQFGPSLKNGTGQSNAPYTPSSSPSANNDGADQSTPDSGEVQYPDEDINPEDIPF